jgi:hypothetical protein
MTEIFDADSDLQIFNALARRVKMPE